MSCNEKLLCAKKLTVQAQYLTNCLYPDQNATSDLDPGSLSSIGPDPGPIYCIIYVFRIVEIISGSTGENI